MLRLLAAGFLLRFWARVAYPQEVVDGTKSAIYGIVVVFYSCHHEGFDEELTPATTVCIPRG